MTLDSYMIENGIKGVDLAATLGISEASLTRIRRGEQNISRDLIRRIIEALDGKVTADDLVFWRHSPAITPDPAAAATGQKDELSGERPFETGKSPPQGERERVA